MNKIIPVLDMKQQSATSLVEIPETNHVNERIIEEEGSPRDGANVQILKSNNNQPQVQFDKYQAVTNRPVRDA